MELKDMMLLLRGYKDRKEVLEAELKAVNENIRQLAERDIPEYMEDNEIEKMSVDGLGTVYLTNKVYANVKAEDREDFYAWLREHGAGDLIRETVHPSTLNSFAKEALTEGRELPEILSAKIYPTATLRRS